MTMRGQHLVVAERADHPALGDTTLCTPDDYLEGQDPKTVSQDLTIVNLCRSYDYLTRGYYVSLLADARRQRALPNLQMIEEITNPYAYFTALRGNGLDTIDFQVVRGRHLLPKIIIPTVSRDEPDRESGALRVSDAGVHEPVRYRREGELYEEITAVFGRTLDPRFRKHCAGVFRVYPFPLLRIRFYREDKRWKVGQIFPVAPHRVAPAELELLRQELSTGRIFQMPAAVRETPYRIAVLIEVGTRDVVRPVARGIVHRGRECAVPTVEQNRDVVG